MSNEKAIYTGWKKWTPTIDEWARFITEPYLPFPMEENEYLLVYVEEEGKKKLTAQYYLEGGKLIKFGRSSISWDFSKFKPEPTEVEVLDSEIDDIEKRKRAKKSTSKKSKSLKNSYTISPLNDEQVAAFDLMNNDNITFKLLSGNFGSGKTLLTCAKAIDMLIHNKVEKIVWIRNVVKAKGTETLGYLPGDLWSKIRPWIAPLIDNLKSESAVLHMIERGQLEIVELDKIRGRSIDNAVIISTESQNLTEDLLQLILGRVGKGSYLFMEGDLRQVDRDIFEKSQGMKAAIRDLVGERLFGYVDLPVDERSETARLADKIGRRAPKAQNNTQ